MLISILGATHMDVKPSITPATYATNSQRAYSRLHLFRVSCCILKMATNLKIFKMTYFFQDSKHSLYHNISGFPL